MSDLDRALAAIAAEQRMLLTLDDFRRVGGSNQHANTRVRAGRLIQVDHGVYLIAGAPWDWNTRMLASSLSAGPPSCATHLAAGRVWGIPGYLTAGRELSVRRGVRYRREGVRVHESTDLDRCTIVRREGVPVTDPARTLLDIARYVHDFRLARNVEWCRRHDLTDWSRLISTLRRHARRGRPGIQRLRRVIVANAHREEITDSDFEHLVLALLLEHGLPEPVLHHEVFDGDRFVGEIDLAYPELKIAIEVDGDLHLRREVRERDIPKQNDVVLNGWLVLRITWERFQLHPESIVSEVRAALRSRAA